MTKKSRKPARRCLFCGGTGLSREHIIARWIGRALDSTLPPGTTARYHHHSENLHVGIGPLHKAAGGPAFYTRAFCRKCNNGWMATLEEGVRPLLEPMLRGDPVALDTAGQELIAFWATKTILGFQSIEDPRTHWAAAETYSDLYRLQGPLPYSSLWLGANMHGEPVWQRSHALTLPDGSAAPGSFGATLAVGYALLHLMVLPGGGRLRLTSTFNGALREIWPGAGRSFAWPPPRRADTRDFTALAQMIANNSVLEPPAP